ncbi:WD40-repeat-containing domain protein [Dichotomocladium elegans]|nr:WD40-repeat-containing domain protein [Dichotomocladium elegans]
MGDASAADDYIHPESSSRTPRRILHYGSSRRSPDASSRSDLPTAPRFQVGPFSDVGRRVLAAPHRTPRLVNRTAIKVLDAPELQDDFYLNLIDWGNNDSLAVGLGTCVYMWNANTSIVTKLCDTGNDLITSVSWAQHGSHLAVGTNRGSVLLWDVGASRRIRTFSGHTLRTGALAWSNNILTSGSRDHKIFHRDVRSPRSYFRELVNHTQEVCGLKWSPDGSMLASGGNDNNLLIWESHHDRALWTFQEHTAAVKAIGWNPHSRGTLVSGGGTADKTIKFWNTIAGTLISSHNTGSQVCNVTWSKKSNEIVSTHGYSSNSDNSSNQVIVWKANNMQQIATLSGHTSRVLYMSISHDGSTIVTGAGDETLRFWDVFSNVEVNRQQPENRQNCLR